MKAFKANQETSKAKKPNTKKKLPQYSDKERRDWKNEIRNLY
jgi:hypothetical protein